MKTGSQVVMEIGNKTLYGETNSVIPSINKRMQYVVYCIYKLINTAGLEKPLVVTMRKEDFDEQIGELDGITFVFTDKIKKGCFYISKTPILKFKA